MERFSYEGGCSVGEAIKEVLARAMNKHFRFCFTTKNKVLYTLLHRKYTIRNTIYGCYVILSYRNA